jgi:hypothetical protein
MTTVINPNLGAAGLWTLNAPFNAALQANVSYKCMAIRKLSDIIAAGGDPFSTYYSPLGLSQTQYQADVAANASIVSLQASGGTWVYVPNTYIAQMPNPNNITYRSIVLGALLGPLPDSLDLTYVKSQVVNAVQDAIGVTPVMNSLAVSAALQISPAEDASLKAARAALIASNDTPTARLIALQAKYDTLQQQFQTLVTWLQGEVASGAIVVTGPGSGGSDGGTGPVTSTVTSTFAPASLPGGLELANSNMQVIATANEWQTARTTYGQSAGLLYCEFTINRLTGAVGFGICNQLEAPNGELGADANGIMMYTNMANATSGIFYLGGTIDTIGTQAPSQNSTVGIAVNIPAGLIWFYNPITQQWNGDTPANQNPVGNIGGISISSITKQNGLAAQVFPAASLWQVADAVTFNAGATAFVNTIPAGYQAWNTEITSTTNTST